VYFNDFTNQYNNVDVVFRVKNRAPRRPDIRELDIPIPFENGIADFKTLLGQYGYIIDGTMYPGGDAGSEAGLAKLRKVCSLELNQADVTTDSGYVPYQYSEFTSDKQVMVKPLYVQIVESSRMGLVQDFRIICKIKDPTIFSATLNQASTQAADFSAATGTAIFPFTFPIIFGSSTSSVSIDAINNGDLPAYPVTIQIHGPVNVPKITNTTTGEYIEVDVNLATVDNVLAISYDKDTLSVTVDGVSQISKVSTDSTYWKLQPGSNVISLTGSSISDDAYATVSYRSAWPL